MSFCIVPFLSRYPVWPHGVGIWRPPCLGGLSYALMALASYLQLTHFTDARKRNGGKYDLELPAPLFEQGAFGCLTTSLWPQGGGEWRERISWKSPNKSKVGQTSWEEMLDTRQLEEISRASGWGLSSLLNVTQLYSLSILKCLPHFLACVSSLPS